MSTMYLLDTCAITRLASSPRAAELASSNDRCWTPLVPWTILLELLQKLADEPGHLGCISACQLLLSLWPIKIIPLSATGWMKELKALPSYCQPWLNDNELDYVKSLLTTAVAGGATGRLGAERRRAAELVSHQREEQLATLLADTTRRPVTHAWVEELKAGSVRDAKTDLMIAGYLPLLGLTYPPLEGETKLKTLRRLIWTDAQHVPHWAGLTRVTLYTDWWHDSLRPRIERARANGRKSPLPEQNEYLKLSHDLYNLIPCLTAEAVVTDDARLRRRGSEVFPEIGWCSSAEFEHRLTAN